MENRSSVRAALGTTPTDNRPIPMPGRITVRRYTLGNDWDSLDQVADNTVVTTVGTITTVRYLDRARIHASIRHGRSAGLGRAMIVITDQDGNSAYVTLNQDVVHQIAPMLYKGAKLWIRGTVIRTHPGQPAGIDGRGIQVVDA